MKVSGFCRIAWCFLRCAIAVAIVWCILVEVAEAFAGSLFGMELDGDCILIVSGSSMDECAAFARLYALPIAIAVSVLSAAFVGAVAMAAFSSRRVFMTVVGIISACICLRVVHVGSFRAWKPAYVAFDMLRSAHVYQSVGAAGRWTADRAAKVRNAPECATNYVFVIGESLTTMRLPFFGYGKNTAPKLSALGGSLAKIGPIRAPSPYTVTSLMKLLVADGGSAPVWFRLAGWRTCFVGAQDRWGRYCSVESAIFAACERKVYLGEVHNGARVYDGQLLPIAGEMMAENDGRPFALFMHMIGSHFQPEDRVPPGFADDDELDGYDRSVRYTDEVLARLIAMLPPRTELFFISDHGESVDSEGWRNFRSKALWSVPMFVYPAEAAPSSATSGDDFVAVWKDRAGQWR